MSIPKIPGVISDVASADLTAGPLEAIAPIVDTVGSISSTADIGIMLGVPAVGMVGGAANWLGKKNLLPGGKMVGGILQKPKNFLDKPSNLGFTDPKLLKESLDKMNANLPPEDHIKHATLGNDLWHGTQVVGSLVQTFQVASSYLKKRKVLNLINADMAADRTARGLGRGSNTAPLDAANSHVTLEHGLRGLITAASVVLTVRGMRRGNLSNWAFFAPMIANFGIDAVMGEDDLINAYVPFRDAQKHGQLTQKDYAEFLFAVSKEMNSRGKMAQPAAMKLAEHYMAENASAAHILNDMSNGTFKKLLADAVVSVDTEQHSAPRDAQTPMQNRLNGAPLVRPVIGEHTGKLHHKAVEQGAMPTLHRT